MHSRSPYACWLLALTAPLLVQLVWLLHNTQLPISDATGSLAAAHRLAGLALSGKWQEFFYGLYWIRDWRPTALCLVETPFALLSGNNLMGTVAGMTLTSTFISVTYIFLLLRLALPPVRAALGATLIGLMPAIQFPATYFGYTETPFMAAMLGAFYHLLRTEHFRNRRHACYMAIAATLAFSLRPVEAVFHFVPVLCVYVWQAKKNGYVSTAETWLSCTAAAIGTSVLVIAGWWPHGLFVFPQSQIFSEPEQARLFIQVGSAVMLATAMLTGIVAVRLISQPQWRRALAAPSPLLISVSVISSMVCIFYLPYMTELVQWIYITNLGELGNVVAPKLALDKVLHFLRGTGLLPLSLLSILAVLSVRNSHTRIAFSPLLVLLAAIPVTFTLTFFTCQFSQRKVTVLFACLLVFLCSLALRKSVHDKLRMTLIILITLWQAGGVLWISLGKPHTALLEATIGSRAGFAEMVTARPNPHDTVLEFLLSRAQRYGYRSISLPILGGEVPRLVDPFLLNILSEMRTKDVEIFFPHINRDNMGDITNPQGLFGGDAFLVAADRKLNHTAGDAAAIRRDASVSWLPTDVVAYEILARHAEGTLEAIGVHKRDCMIVAPTEIEVCLYDYARIP